VSRSAVFTAATVNAPLSLVRLLFRRKGREISYSKDPTAIRQLRFSLGPLAGGTGWGHGEHCAERRFLAASLPHNARGVQIEAGNGKLQNWLARRMGGRADVAEC
jgi:hypothetical protein